MTQRKIEVAKLELDQAQREGDLGKAVENFPMEEFLKSKKQIEEARGQAENALLREEVTEEDIAAAVSRWTGIPVDKMMAESEKLLKMEEWLGQRVIGQTEQ